MKLFDIFRRKPNDFWDRSLIRFFADSQYNGSGHELMQSFMGLSSMKQVYIAGHGMQGCVLEYGHYTSGIATNLSAGFVVFKYRDGTVYKNFKSSDISQWSRDNRMCGGADYEIPILTLTDEGAAFHSELRDAVDNEWGPGTYFGIISNEEMYKGLHQQIHETKNADHPGGISQEIE